DDIKLTVPVDITDGQGVGTRPDREGRAGRGREANLSIAQQHGDIVIVVVRGDQIQLAVAIHVRQGQAVGVWVLPPLRRHGGTRRGREPALTVSEEDGDGVAVVVGEGDVQVVITVDVTQANLPGTVGELDG